MNPPAGSRKPPATPYKPETTCWGCGAKESDSPEGRFLCCPTRKKLKVITAKFCSQACFREAWPRHKECHTDSKHGLKTMKAGAKLMEKIATESPPWASLLSYDDFMSSAFSKMKSQNVVAAKKAFRAALKLDPRRPDAYYNLAMCYEVSGFHEEMLQYMEQAVERFAFVAAKEMMLEDGGHIEITHQPGYALNNWALCIFKLTCKYIFFQEGNRWNKPFWYCQDAMLKKVTKMALEIIKATRPDDCKLVCTMFTIHALSLSGMAANGLNFPAAFGNPPEDCSPAELTEAAACFEIGASGTGSYHFFPFQVELFKRQAEVLRKIAISRSLRSPGEPTDSSSSLQVGSWVILHGLKSAIELPMNRKIGLLHSRDEMQERFVVQVDGFAGQKLIHTCNLIDFKLPDSFVALVACMEGSDQWDYMRELCEISIHTL